MIPYGRQSIDESDIEAVVESLRSDFLTQGPAIDRFEKSLAGRCGSGYAVACNSGTAALHMAYAAAGVGPGSTVVVPANTFLATANAAVYLGADVRFADVDPESGLVTAETLADVLDHSVTVVAPVHFAGQACDMEAIESVTRRLAPGATLVEDASHAIGAIHVDGSPVGASRFSAMTTFSFHPVKHVAAGEGGAVTTDCPELLKQLQRFRCHGMTKDPDELQRPEEGPWYYEMHEPGFNYRIPEASCALAASQVKKLDGFVARRREIAARYLDALAEAPAAVLPPRSHLSTSAWHLFCLHIDFEALGKPRQQAMAELRDAGVGTQVHYYPVPLQPYYARLGGWCASDFPGAVEHYTRAISIPLFPAMTDGDVETVVDAVLRVLANANQTRRHAA